MDNFIWHCAKYVAERQTVSIYDLEFHFGVRRFRLGSGDAKETMGELERLGIVDKSVNDIYAQKKVLVQTVEELKEIFDADFIAEAESPFLVTKNEFCNSYDIMTNDITGGCLFWFMDKEKRRLHFEVTFEHNEFLLHLGIWGMFDLKKGTVIHFQFQSNQILSYEIKFATKIVVSINDLYLFEKEEIKVVLVDYKKENRKVQLYIKKWDLQNMFDDGDEETQLALTENFNNNQDPYYEKSQSVLSELLKKVNELNPSHLKDIEKIGAKSNTECYVYLMIDLANNFYKIGISNDLQIRESTLQSEKPTIKLIADKKFINRKIASVFEKTLHSVYETKRIRGEWFNLDSSELNEVIITLKS